MFDKEIKAKKEIERLAREKAEKERLGNLKSQLMIIMSQIEENKKDIKKKKDAHNKKESTHLGLFILGGVVLYFLSGWVDELRVYQGASIAVYVIAISSIILLTGYSGQVSLGHGALMAVGAYAAAVARVEFNLPIVLCFVVAVLAAAIGGAGEANSPRVPMTCLAIGSSTNVEFGVVGFIENGYDSSPFASTQRDMNYPQVRTNDVGVYARINIPIGAPKERINCNSLYQLELRKKRLEVLKLQQELEALRRLNNSEASTFEN